MAKRTRIRKPRVKPIRRMGTEVLEDIRTKRKRTRAADEAAAITREIDELLEENER